MTQRKQLHFFIVDDDPLSIEVYAQLLKNDGHKVTAMTSGLDALKSIITEQPDCVLCDYLMPQMDGLELFNRIRKTSNIKQPVIIFVTSKVFEFDRRRALEQGVNGYLAKPIHPDTFVEEVMEIIDYRMVVEFYGVRGSLPVPGHRSVRYGGNTNCLTLSVAHKHYFIFDAGTGIKELSNKLLKKNKFPIKAKVFISHPHYDHINGIPFFAPFYMPGNEFDFYGTKQGDITLEAQLSSQMDSVYFPVTINEFKAKITFHNLVEESFTIDDLSVQTLLLNHPGSCLGYRIQHGEKSFCYITDNELYLESSPHHAQNEVDRLIHFIKDTDLLVIDATYKDDDYPQKVGWGHSCVSRVVDLADKANVKTVCLFHHDPDQCDDDIDMKVEQARKMLEERGSTTQCIAPREGDKIII